MKPRCAGTRSLRENVDISIVVARGSDDMENEIEKRMKGRRHS